MKILTVIGARPQFIKAAPVSKALRQEFQEILVHTGQHYDQNMSKVFFEELGIPHPDYNLGIGSGNHGYQTGAMLAQLEELVLKENPDMVLVYGDTNSTLAGALAASKLLVPVMHVEAGLRSYNKAMPEEQNRILTDHLATWLLCPTDTAVANLKKEGISQGVFNVGDVMYDAILHYRAIAQDKSAILSKLGLEPGKYALATIHRAENTNHKERLTEIVEALNSLQKPIVLPIHPRTKGYLAQYGLVLRNQVRVIEPVGYLDMIALEANAAQIITDSGGVQKEAFFLDVPCITLRDETEWVETVESGWNILAGAKCEEIREAVAKFQVPSHKPTVFGEGNAAEKIAQIISTGIPEKGLVR